MLARARPALTAFARIIKLTPLTAKLLAIFRFFVAVHPPDAGFAIFNVVTGPAITFRTGPALGAAFFVIIVIPKLALFTRERRRRIAFVLRLFKCFRFRTGFLLRYR